jgi:inorganic pyrophosphatase
MSLQDLPFGEIESFNVVIEISQGSQDKYEYDETLDVIKLDRVLYSSYHFPTNYGFIPETRAEDGDHTDVLLFSTNPLIPGTVAVARAIGIMEMIDSGEQDHKIVAVPVHDPRFDDIQTLNDLPAHYTKEIRAFFETYKLLQNKVVEVKGFQGKDRAIQELEHTKKAYESESHAT